MRIIAGEFRGRKLDAPRGDGTRPTTDRVRESLMSALVSLRDGLDGLAVHFQLVGAGRDLEARRGDGLAVDADAPGGDELVGPTAGTDAGVRQRFVDSYGLFHDTPGRACAGPFPAGILRWRLPIMWARMPFRQGICE